jgi:DNA-binding IclR family transcriptional regulator
VPQCRTSPPRSVVGRITAILSTFHAGDRHSVTEIARLTKLPVSTTHRLVAELAAWQLLYRSGDGRYRIGLAVQQLRGEDWAVPSLHERGARVLTDLSAATQRRARLGVLVGDRVSYAEKRPDAEPVTGFCPGATLPAHATALGKALLAFAPMPVAPFAGTGKGAAARSSAPRATTAGRHSSEVAGTGKGAAARSSAPLPRDLRAYTARTLGDPDRLRRALNVVRLTRLAVCDGELVPGECTVAVPVFAPGGGAVAALELEVVDLRAEMPVCRATLAVAAAGLARELAADSDASWRPHLRVLEASRSAAGG